MSEVAIQIIETETGLIEHVVEVSRPSSIDRVERGLLMRIDTDRFHTRPVKRVGDEWVDYDEDE